MSRSSPSTLASLALASALCASVARAQERCADDASECLGVPAAAASPSLPTAPTEHGARPRDTTSWPSAPPASLASAVDSRVRPVRRVDGGWIAAGVTALVIGYAGGLAVGVLELIDTARCVRSGCGTWPLAAIPIAGGLLSGTVAWDGAVRQSQFFGWTIGLPALVAQAVGLAFVIGGVVPGISGDDADEVRLTIAPLVGPDTAGVSLRLEQ